MNKITWGIIGCGDVTEKKSGPAFNKVTGSELVAVMRRDEEKVIDYAKRHNVPKWYTNAADLVNDPDINAIYIATPPDSHEQYCLQALEKGKDVYLEKPMTTDAAAAARICEALGHSSSKLSVAHYRRAQPLFLKLKELIDNRVIGTPRIAVLELFRECLSANDLLVPKMAWRVNKQVAGCGLFQDMSPHQFDIFLHLFGKPVQVSGSAFNQAGVYDTDDVVAGTARFANGLLLQGAWCFTVGAHEEKDTCTITGDKGSLQFSFFDNRKIILTREGRSEIFEFGDLEHVQQPMIQKVVDYFLGKGENPCPAEDGLEVMKIIDAVASR